MNGGSVTPSNPLPDGKYKFKAEGDNVFELMTASGGIIQVYAASESEGNNLNGYSATGVCVSQMQNASILTSIATIAKTYDNFVYVERTQMDSDSVDISEYETLE